MNIPKTVSDRITKGVKRYQKVLADAALKDINESDTVTIVLDILTDIMGYDRYADITKEFAIRGYYCDLAVKTGAKIHFLIEVKAIGVELKQNHLKQAQGYATDVGLDYVILTNGISWKVFKLSYKKPIELEIVFELNVLSEHQKLQQIIDMFYLLSKEGLKKSAINEYNEKLQATSRYTISAIVLTSSVISAIKKQLKAINASIKITDERIAEVLRNDVLKRDTLEGEKALAAMQLIKKLHRNITKVKTASTQKAEIAQ